MLQTGLKNLQVLVLFAVGLLGMLASVAATAEPSRSGAVRFMPVASEASLPPHFQLPEVEFRFDEQPLESVSQAFAMSNVTFPSPMHTEQAANNTVHCEFFRPLAPGRHPGVVVLHILGGDFDLSRLFCRSLASHNVAALFVKMPHYGPRREPGSTVRMVSLDPRETVRGMTQAVLDVRRATAWLGAQDSVDGEQLGIMGISLGGITSALAATAEPRLKNVCLLMAGGDIAAVAWESRELKKLREKWIAAGGNRESLIDTLKMIDPVTYGANVRGRRILMLNARQDEVIPPACTESLWRAFGEPEIRWWNAGHYSAALHIFEGLAATVEFFEVKPAGDAPSKSSTQ
jgi:dienelactone hydrolase